MSKQDVPAVTRMSLAGLLAWLVPGLGHLYLGLRAQGLVFMVTITATFWTGVAIGSVQGTVAPRARTLWFAAQLCTGANTLLAYGLHYHVDPQSALSPKPVPTVHWASAEVGVHYTGVAGLLNLLVMLDAIARAEVAPGRGRSKRGPPGAVS